MTTTTPGPTRPRGDVVVQRPGGLVPYLDGWALQREQHALVADGGPDRLLLLQHEAVYTAGKRTAPSDRPSDGTPVVDVDRGGRITWHGPGQLVGYPLVRLPDPIDVVAYVRALEAALIAVCAEVGLPTGRVDGRSGVWVRGDGSPGPGGLDRKVAAIGVRVARGVTMHGFALNCDCDLSWAAPIVPCGIPDAGVTSLSAELGRQVRVADVLDLVEREVLAALPSA
ncbi:lipoyl(octanoyl) transferase LipB [Aquipuribacter sp. MA13-6]|uniref:lipoyl(octanoyl) transferase LipB n=1 Tax=unclassified Aquipuribacter TaxID=2635084 RepID=UPI003EEE2206